jgi:outer membrane receptor protein involved in Fe transport
MGTFRMKAILFAVLLTGAQVLLAQVNTATVFGTVRDASGAVVPGVAVQIRNVQTGIEWKTVSSSAGDYALPRLPVGQYTLSAEKAGFKTFVQKGISLVVNQNARVDVTLAVGQVTQTVNVEANATHVNTLTGTLQETVGERSMVELPLNGRNPLQLLTLTAGTAQTDNLGGRAQNNGYSINGTRPDSNNYVLDGGDYNDPYFNLAPVFPSPDALQEFTVIDNSYSAEYGRNAGGVINAVMRSGTNQLHGDAYEFVRNQILDAAPFTFAGPHTRSPFHLNQFGGTLGGPVVLPGIYNGKDRTFFFVSYEGGRQRSGANNSTAGVPTPAERTGDFSADKPIRDPLTGKQFPGNIIPTNRLDPTAQNFLKAFVPLPNAGDHLLTFPPNTVTNANQFIAKVDHMFGEKNHFSARYIYYGLNGVSPQGNLPGFSEYPQARDDNIFVSNTSTFTPTLLNAFSFGYGRINQTLIPHSPGDLSWADLGANIPRTGNTAYPTEYNLNVPGYFNANTGNHTVIPRHNYQILDNVTWSHGKHMLKFGGEVRRVVVGSSQGQDYITDPQINFSAAFTGNAIADFMLGKPAAYVQLSPFPGGALSQWAYATYAEDTFRMRPNFTLNLGLRWEPFLPMTSPVNRLATFIPGAQSQIFPTAPPGMLVGGDPGIPRSIMHNDYDNWAPRASFAWDPTGKGTTAIRAGYGIFYDALQVEQYSGFGTNPPYLLQVILRAPPSLTNPFGSNPIPFPYTEPTTPAELAAYKFALPIALTAESTSYSTPYSQQWNFNIQHQFGKDWLLTVGYVGTKGTHLFGYYEGNPAVYIPGKSTTGNVDARRIYAPNYGSIKQEGSFENSTYHALQVTLNKHFSHGFTVLSNYTYGKTIDMVSAGTAYGSDQPSDPFNLRADKGPADFDITHRWITSFVWQMPGPSTQYRVARWFLGNWQSAGIFGVQSGTPFSIFSGSDNSFSGVGRDRADLVGNPNLPSGRSEQAKIAEYFNTAAFAVNLPGTFGTSGRNILRGPGGYNLDFSLVKRIPFTERVRMDLRGEFFNAFNQPHLGGVNHQYGSNLFGQMTSAGTPRVIQLALRLVF